jgi:hypothetical protein
VKYSRKRVIKTANGRERMRRDRKRKDEPQMEADARRYNTVEPRSEIPKAHLHTVRRSRRTLARDRLYDEWASLPASLALFF